MAITKVLHMSADFENVVSSHLDNAIDYILQEKKLGRLHLSGGINCMTSGTYEQMMATKKMFGKMGGRQGYHFILSLKPGEGTPQQMYEIAMKFAERAFHNEYEAVVAVHTDKDRIHAHIVLNSVNMATGYKFQYKKGDWKRLYQPITNELCEEYGLSIVPAEYSREPSNVPRNEFQRDMKFHDLIREDCECLLALSEDTAHFIWLLRRLGYEVKEGMHIAVKVPGMKRFARLDTIDKRYARDNLEQTIAEAQGRKIHFPVRTFNTDQYYQSALNLYPKRYYYQIRGIRVVEKYRFGYKAAKYYKDIMLLQKLQEEYLFLCDNHIHSFEDLLDYRSNAVDELNQIRSEQQEIYARNAALKRKCDTPEGLREYQAEHLKNGQRLDELKKKAGQLRKGKSLSERQMAASINEALERIGRDYPAESLEIDPSISDVPEYPVAVVRLKAEKERREAEARAEAERQAAKRAAEERAKREAEVVAEAVRCAAEQARRKTEKEVEARRRAIEEEKRIQEIQRKEAQKKKERIRGLYDQMISEADKLADIAYGLRFDQPYKWEYINYLNERRLTPMAELTEEDMQKPFLTYEQFVAEKERLRESAIVDMLQREDIPEIRKPDLEDERLQAEIEYKDVGQSESSYYTIVQTDSPNLSIFPTGVSDTLVQRESAYRIHDSLRSTESDSEKIVEKTVTKQDYQRMTDKEKAEWIGISLSDMPGSIKRFKSRMEQIGIWHESTLEMTEAFMKLWNQAEKERDAKQPGNDYKQIKLR